MRRPSPALAIALLALFIALDGPAAAQRAAKSISGSRLKNNSVTGAKIRNGTVSNSDLSAAARRRLGTPRNGTVSAAKLRTSAVNTPSLATGAVTSEKIANGSVGNTKIGENAIDSAKVADGSLFARDVTSAFGEARLDFGPIPAGGCARETFNPPGDVRFNDDVVAVTPPAVFDDGVQVTSELGENDETFAVLACNHTAAVVDPGPTNFRYAVLNL